MRRRPLIDEMVGLGGDTVSAGTDPHNPHHDPESPKPLRLEKRAVAWRESEIIPWINSRKSDVA